MNVTHALLDATLVVANDAGAVLLTHFGHHGRVTYKSDNSPVTRADLDSQALLTERLGEVVDAPVFGEENYPPLGERRSVRTYWLVDPLDGTKEFVAGEPEFTVNVALMVDGRPAFGVIVVPALKLAYAGGAPLGAFRRSRNGQLPLPLINPPHWIMGKSRFHHVMRAATFAHANNFTEHRVAGAAWKFGLLAEGHLAVYPRFEDCQEWDTAAGDAILSAVGGSVMTLEGQPLQYNKAQSKNPYFIATAPGVDRTTLVVPPDLEQLPELVTKSSQ